MSQTICQFYAKGTCKFGTRCKFRHIMPNASVGPVITGENIRDDLNQGNLYPFSCYSPFITYPPNNLISGIDNSVEELRLEYYKNAQLYLSNLPQLMAEASAKKKQVLDNADLLAKGEKVPISNFPNPVTSAFASPRSSAFTQQGPAFSQQSSAFSQPSGAFSQPVVASSAFLQPNSSVSAFTTSTNTTTSPAAFNQPVTSSGTLSQQPLFNQHVTAFSRPQSAFNIQPVNSNNNNNNQHPIWSRQTFEFGKLPVSEPPEEYR